jgi:hypothetical protein
MSALHFAQSGSLILLVILIIQVLHFDTMRVQRAAVCPGLMDLLAMRGGACGV